MTNKKVLNLVSITQQKWADLILKILKSYKEKQNRQFDL